MCYGKYVLQTSALTLSCPQQPAVLYCDSCSGSGALQLVCDDTEGAVVLSSEEANVVRELFAMASSRDDDSVTLQEALDTLALLRVPESTNKLLSLFWEGQSDTVPMEIALQVLMHAFTTFAEAEGPSGCITYDALKQALVRNGGDKMLDSDIEKLLAEVVASPHDLIDYHNIVSSFY